MIKPVRKNYVWMRLQIDDIAPFIINSFHVKCRYVITRMVLIIDMWSFWNVYREIKTKLRLAKSYSSWFHYRINHMDWFRLHSLLNMYKIAYENILKFCKNVSLGDFANFITTECKYYCVWTFDVQLKFE